MFKIFIPGFHEISFFSGVHYLSTPEYNFHRYGTIFIMPVWLSHLNNAIYSFYGLLHSDIFKNNIVKYWLRSIFSSNRNIGPYKQCWWSILSVFLVRNPNVNTVYLDLYCNLGWYWWISSECSLWRLHHRSSWYIVHTLYQWFYRMRGGGLAKYGGDAQKGQGVGSDKERGKYLHRLTSNSIS